MVSQRWLDHARFCTCADCCFNEGDIIIIIIITRVSGQVHCA